MRQVRFNNQINAFETAREIWQEEDLRQQNEDIRQLNEGIQRTQIDCQRMMDYEDSQFINTIATAIASDKEHEIRHLKIELAEAQVQMNRLKELNEEDEHQIQCPIETSEKIAIPKAVLKIR